MPDIEIIEKHIESYILDLENLKKNKNITVKQISEDIDRLWILERGLYLLIQNLLDMLAHIVSSDFNEPWDFYSDLGEILESKHIISQSQKELLNQMVGFRNRLSHEYLSLDKEVLADVINNRLNDFNVFLLIIKDYCKI